MSGSFTRILAKKLCRIVICSPPAPGTSSSNPDYPPNDDDPSIGLSHDHRYAGRRPGSPGIPAKRQRALNCTRSLSCTCVDCLQPSLTPTTSSDLVSFASGVQVVSHELADTKMLPVSVSPPMVALKTVKTEEEAEEEPVEEAVLSPTSSTNSGEHKLTSNFTCRICNYQAERLSTYMGHLESVHAWIGRVRFQCHFCPLRFSSYTELAEHSRRYLDQIGAGFPPKPYTRSASTEVAKITLH